MKLKLDANLGDAAKRLLEDAGHDVSLGTRNRASKKRWMKPSCACAKDGRALVTLDLDSASPLRFRPAEYPSEA